MRVTWEARFKEVLKPLARLPAPSKGSMSKKIKKAATPEIAIHCAYDKLVPIEQLKPHPKNRNTHPKKQIEALAEVLKYQGIRKPAIVSKRSGFLTTWHGRLEAAKILGLTKIPVNFQDYDSDEQEYADLVADNALPLWADLDLEGVREDVVGLADDFLIEHLGIEEFNIDVEEKESKAIPPTDSQLLVVVECESEEQQAEIFEELNERGLKCKIMS